MIKINDIKINKTRPLATDLFLKFECKDVSAEQYDFLKDRLDSYTLYMDNEYSLESETQYDEYSKFLLIRITISIPDRLMPKDIETGSEIIIEQIKLFRTFYEAQNEIFKKNNGNN